MRVLIFEPQFLGHNLAHAGWLARGVAELGCEPVVATSTQAIESAEFGLHLAEHRDRFRLHPLEGFRTDRLGRRIKTNGVRGVAMLYKSLTAAIRETKPDHVLVPHGNMLTRVAPLPFGLRRVLRENGAEAETLLVSGRFLQAEPSFAGRLRKRLLLETIARGPWTSVFHMDDAAHEHFRRHGGRMARIAKRLPDPYGEAPSEPRDAARAALGVPRDGRAVAVVGLIDRRKGIVELMQAMRSARARLRPNDRLWLAGSFHPEVHELIADRFADLKAAGRIVCLDRQLSNADLARAIRGADVVATVYRNHPYTSGIVVAAAAAERPLLGSDHGWIGRSIRQFGLGHVCRAGEPRDVARRLVASLDASDGYRPTDAGRRFIEYSSLDNFLAHWTARLRERLGVAPSPHLRSWDWVGRPSAARAA